MWQKYTDQTHISLLSFKHNLKLNNDIADDSSKDDYVEDDVVVAISCQICN